MKEHIKTLTEFVTGRYEEDQTPSHKENLKYLFVNSIHLRKEVKREYWKIFAEVECPIQAREKTLERLEDLKPNENPPHLFNKHQYN